MRSDAEEGEVKGEGKGLSASFGLCYIGLERKRLKEKERDCRRVLVCATWD